MMNRRKAAILAKARLGEAWAGIQFIPWVPIFIGNPGFRILSGMTNKVKEFLSQYANGVYFFEMPWPPFSPLQKLL